MLVQGKTSRKVKGLLTPRPRRARLFLRKLAEAPMRAGIALGSLLFVVAGFRPAWSQAVAEGAMVNANSAAAASKAGSVLGDVLNKAAGKVAGQIPAVSPNKTPGAKPNPQTLPIANQPTTAAHTPPSGSNGSFIVSIQGTQKGCPATSAASQQGSSPRSGTPSQPAGCGVKPATQSPPKSVINLPPAQER